MPRRSQALDGARPGGMVPVPPAMDAITLHVPPSKDDLLVVEESSAELETLLAEVEITDDDTYGVADELMTNAVQLLDATKELRGSITGPVYKKIKEVEALFKPHIVRLEGVVIGFKKKVGDYRLQLAQAEAEARAQAQQAAETGNPEALVEALNDADALAKAPADTGAKVAIRWRVKRVNPEMLPDEWWCPDEARIQEVAVTHKGGVDDPPVIPGVVFEPVPVVSASHK